MNIIRGDTMKHVIKINSNWQIGLCVNNLKSKSYEEKVGQNDIILSGLFDMILFDLQIQSQIIS